MGEKVSQEYFKIMGATNQIKETNIGHALIGKKCSQCNREFVDKEILTDNNWGIDFDTSNDVILEDNKIKGYGYNLTIWIRNVYHENCDDTKELKKVEEKKKEPTHCATGRYGKKVDGSFELKEKKRGLYGIDLEKKG